MKAVILAAGFGKRMGQLTATTPKPLLIVEGKAILEYILDALPSEIDTVIVVIGYRGDQIRSMIGDQRGGKRIYYVVNSDIHLGNAHSLRLTHAWFEPHERFLLTYADELLTPVLFERCLALPFSWAVKRSRRPENGGVATLSVDGRILAVTEKPKRPRSDVVVVGAMVINADIFHCKSRKHRNGEHYVTALMNQFVKTHAVIAVSAEDHRSFTTPEDITTATSRSI